MLVYLAEDALPIVRERVEGMARHRGLELAGVDIHVITAPGCAWIASPIAIDCSKRPGNCGPACCCWIRWCGCTAWMKTTPAELSLLPLSAATGSVSDPGASHAQTPRG